ncbi:type II/IV secretion system protein [Candidatus Uhrbacteria bacterium]|nr:type II/IV secretion system protein [Candidatus Uhrbacteria bacterium]
MALEISELRKMLVGSGLVPEADFEAAVRESSESGQFLDRILVERGLVPDEYLGQMVAEGFGVPFVSLGSREIPDETLRIIPERVARRSRMVAFGRDGSGKVLLAMADPTDLETIRLIEKRAGVPVVVHYATDVGLARALERYSTDLESAIRGVLDRKGADGDDGEGIPVTVVEMILGYAFQSGASDVHIEPQQKGIAVRYRVDGILHDRVNLPRDLLDPIISRIKVMSRMRTDEHFAAQDGKFQEVIDGRRVDIRVSVLPVVDGEKVVMRLMAEKGRRFDLADLGFSVDDLKRIRHHSQRSYGMILATGPTGSGKTTTMYAVLKTLNTRDVNIATIEDPIEYAIEGVSQIQVNPKVGLTFASGLRSIVRQDPDIVMVGEIRDEETAGIAVNAAMTGHLVLSTLHTNDAATTLPRFRDMNVEPFLISSSINLIIAQRLVRKICSRCIVSADVTEEELGERMSGDMVRELYRLRTSRKGPLRLYRGKGCVHCGNTGYSGRIGIYELLEVTDAVRELIMAEANAKVIRGKAVEEGMTTMLEDGFRKAISGQTTIDEVLRVAGE